MYAKENPAAPRLREELEAQFRDVDKRSAVVYTRLEEGHAMLDQLLERLAAPDPDDDAAPTCELEMTDTGVHRVARALVKRRDR